MLRKTALDLLYWFDDNSPGDFLGSLNIYSTLRETLYCQLYY